MSLTMYQASIPVITRGLNNLAQLLEKAEAYAEAKKINPSVLLSSRLYPDMLPLLSQVQITSDTAKGIGARLAGLAVPSFEDTETTFNELQNRIRKTLAFLNSIDDAQINGSEERAVIVPSRNGDRHFTGQSYLLTFALPNFYFHITTAYAILRHNGLEIGKKDYLGAL